jgi:hypothetical protein
MAQVLLGHCTFGRREHAPKLCSPLFDTHYKDLEGSRQAGAMQQLTLGSGSETVEITAIGICPALGCRDFQQRIEVSPVLEFSKTQKNASRQEEGQHRPPRARNEPESFGLQVESTRPGSSTQQSGTALMRMNIKLLCFVVALSCAIFSADARRSLKAASTGSVVPASALSAMVSSLKVC